MATSNPRVVSDPSNGGGGYDSPQSIYEASTTKHHAIGTKAVLGDRVFYYARSTGAAITRGHVCRVAAATTNHRSITPAASVAAGATSITVTLGATSAAENLYQDGWLTVIDGGGGIGQARAIKTHTSGSSGGTVTVELWDAFEDDVAATDELSLLKGKYHDVVVTPGNAAVAIAGVPQANVPAGTSNAQYFWLQTWGPGMAIGDGSSYATGSLVTYATAGTADAGQVSLIAPTATAVADVRVVQVLGSIIDVGDPTSDGDARFVDFHISQ